MYLRGAMILSVSPLFLSTSIPLSLSSSSPSLQCFRISVGGVDLCVESEPLLRALCGGAERGGHVVSEDQPADLQTLQLLPLGRHAGDGYVVYWSWIDVISKGRFMLQMFFYSYVLTMPYCSLQTWHAYASVRSVFFYR